MCGGRGDGGGGHPLAARVVPAEDVEAPLPTLLPTGIQGKVRIRSRFKYLGRELLAPRISKVAQNPGLPRPEFTPIFLSKAAR